MNSNGNQANAALAEMMAAELEAKEFGVAGEMTIPQPQIHPPQQPRPFHIPPPDWHQEELERKERDRQRQEDERRKILEEELAKISDDSEPPETLPRRRGWKREATP